MLASIHNWMLALFLVVKVCYGACPTGDITFDDNEYHLLGPNIFKECTGITSVYINDSIKIIGNYAFYKCTSLSSVHLPLGLLDLEESAFSHCSALTSIEIPSGITRIQRDVFVKTNIRSFIVPANINVDFTAFSGVCALDSIELDGDDDGIRRSMNYLNTL